MSHPECQLAAGPCRLQGRGIRSRYSAADFGVAIPIRSLSWPASYNYTSEAVVLVARVPGGVVAPPPAVAALPRAVV
jgi:hypothetical protein